MGNLCSSNTYNKDAVIRNLWKSLRAIPVLPINLYLDPLRVLNKQSDGYHDVGNVYSLSKAGEGKDWLKDVIYPRRTLLHKRKENYFLPPRSIGEQISVIDDDYGVLAKALVGRANAEAWFKKFESIEVHIPECEVREFNMEKWEEMIQYFDPELQTSTLGAAGWNGKRDLFVVQKVVLVSHIKITASYKTNVGVEAHAPVMPSQGIDVKASWSNTNSSVVGEFTLSATQKNQKLPVAFSGFSYTYDKFGTREQFGKETRTQPDGEIGESSGASQDESESDDEGAQNDPEMGMFLADEWFTTVIPLDPSLEILPNLQEEEEVEEEVPSDAGEGEEEHNVVDQGPSLEDID